MIGSLPLPEGDALTPVLTTRAERTHRDGRCSVAAVMFSRLSSSLAIAGCAASLVLTLSACGSDSEPQATASTPSATETLPSWLTDPPSTPAAASQCPTAAPAADAAPEWTQAGATGSVAVAGPTDTTAPSVKVEGPFSVTETVVQTLKAGTGPIVAPTAQVLVCYMGVNGRDGSVFDSTYEQGQPIDFGLDRVVPGFQKAIAGQTVGSTVAVAMTSADGYPEGQPSAGINPGDTLVFAIKIIDASA